MNTTLIMSHSETGLEKLDLANRMLAEASTLGEVIQVMDVAETARVWARRAKLGAEAQNKAAHIRILAERYVSIPLRQLFCEFSVASPALVRYTPSPRLTRFVVIG